MNNSISKGINWIAATAKSIADIAAIQQYKRYQPLKRMMQFMKTLTFILAFITLLFINTGCGLNCDPNIPDTSGNKKAFKQLVGFETTSDMHDLYAYSDLFITDAVYQLSFKCKQQTIDSIVKSLELVKDSTLTEGGSLFDFDSKFPKVEKTDSSYKFTRWNITKDRHDQKLSNVEYTLYYDHNKDLGFLIVFFE